MNWNLFLFIIIPLLTMFYPAVGNCKQEVRVDVKIIYASKGKQSIDPRIKDLVEDMNSDFVYSSYELVDQKRFPLFKGEKVVYKIRGGRKLIVTSHGISGGKATLEIECRKKKKQFVKANVDFRNNTGN